MTTHAVMKYSTTGQTTNADNPVVQVSGVFVEKDNEQLIKTPNKTYLLIDENKVINTVEGYQENNSMLQSFNVCVNGRSSGKGSYGKNEYAYELRIDSLCDVAEEK